MSNSTAGTKDQLFFVYIPVGKASSALILVIDLGVLGDYENLIIIVSTIHSKSNSYHLFFTSFYSNSLKYSWKC